MDKIPLQKHSISYPKSQVFEKMYYAIGASVSSLHREPTDSLTDSLILQVNDKSFDLKEGI